VVLVFLFALSSALLSGAPRSWALGLASDRAENLYGSPHTKKRRLALSKVLRLRDQTAQRLQKPPHINHPVAPADEASFAGEAVLVPDVLYDAIEDTDASHDETRETARILIEVSDDKSFSRDRAQAATSTLRRMLVMK